MKGIDMSSKFLFRLLSLVGMAAIAFIVFIKYYYGCSWRESFEVADQFVTDLRS